MARCLVGAMLVRPRFQAPVLTFLHAGSTDGDYGTWLYLPHVLIDRMARRASAGARRQLGDSIHVQLRLDLWMGQQSLRLRAEHDAVRKAVVIQGLDACPVAKQEKLVRKLLPNRKGVHAVEARGDPPAPVQVGN